MITLPEAGNISPILLTVTLIIYLLITELGNEKIKKALMPIIIVLIVIFAIIAAVSVITVYRRLG